MKIRKIKFNNHEILGNLELDFCDKDGNAVDTIFIAGENGTGKSTILEEIYKICNYELDKEFEFEIEINDIKRFFVSKFDDASKGYFFYENNKFISGYNLEFSIIFSNTDINFNADKINTVTSMDVDIIKEKNVKANQNLATEINQLLIDIRTEDNEYIAQNYENGNKNIKKDDLKINRFKRAFKEMFGDDLEFSGVKNEDGHKEILFKRNNKEISIDNLSSGEKQIVYRGSFLLKDKNALNGAIVLIDEPEISLHPDWQKKIMNFYKKIFTNEKIQTSQIMVVTHSPFILHNYNRRNDKVIVLKRENNEIKAMDKPEFYSVGEKVVIQEAFNIQNWINENKNIIFVEGETDVDYFNKAVEIFYKNETFLGEFKMYGNKSRKGGENNGAGKLRDAYISLTTNQSIQKSDIKPIHKVVFLLDCDEKKERNEDKNQNNCYLKFLTKNNNNIEIPGGIENLLDLKNIDIRQFYDKEETIKNDGGKLIKENLNKTKLRDEICNKTDEELEEIFKNFKKVLEDLQEIFKN